MSEGGRTGRSRIAFHAAIISGFVLLTVILTYPLIMHFTTHIPAHRGYGKDVGDHWISMWGLGFIEHMITGSPRWSLFTDALFYPRGVDLTYPFVLGFGLPLAVSIPFVRVLGVIPTYNLFIFGGFISTAYTTFLLVRYLTHDSRAAFLAGVLFAFSPYHMARAVLNLNFAINGVWIPLYLLCFFKAMRSERVRDLVFPPAILALTFAANPYYAGFLSLFTIIYLLYYLVLGNRDLDVGRDALRRLCAMGGLGVLFFLPFVGLLLLHPQNDVILLLHFEDTFQWGADLLAFLVPSWDHALVGRLVGPLYPQLTGNDTEQTVYLGYTVLVLTGVAVWKVPKRETRFWLFTALVFFILALGPFLHIAGRSTYTLGGIELSLPLPDYLLYRYLPLLRAARVSSRFSVMLMLALAVLVGYGTRYLLARWAGRKGATALTVGLILMLIMSEFAIVPMPLADARIPNMYARIAQTGGSGGTLLDVPLDWGIFKYEYYQTVHRKRLLIGQAPRTSLTLIVKYANSFPLVPLFKHPELIEHYDQTPIDRSVIARFIEFFDLGFIVIHKDLLDPDAYGRQGRFDNAPDDLTPLRGPEIFARLMQFLRANFPIAWVEEDGELVVVQLAKGWQDTPPLDEKGGYVIDFGSSTPQFFIADGWSDNERWNTLTVAWSNAMKSRLWLYFPSVEDFAMDLRLLPVRVPDRPAEAVKLYVNEQFLGEIVLDNDGWRTYTLSLPRSYLKHGINVFRFDYRYTASPLVPATGKEDGRQLAVAFDFINFRPQ